MRIDYIIQTIVAALIAGMLIFFVGCKTIDCVSGNGEANTICRLSISNIKT